MIYMNLKIQLHNILIFQEFYLQKFNLVDLREDNLPIGLRDILKKVKFRIMILYKINHRYQLKGAQLSMETLKIKNLSKKAIIFYYHLTANNIYQMIHRNHIIKKIKK